MLIPMRRAMGMECAERVPSKAVERDALIVRSFDAVFFNEVANHPNVRPWLGGTHTIDVTPTLSDPNNYALRCNGGGFILQRHELGIYEVHSQFLPEARPYTRRAMREGFRYMFERADAVRIVTKCPLGNDGAAALAKTAGFRHLFRREAAWDDGGAVDYLALDIDDWALARAEHAADGVAFHNAIETAKEASGSRLTVHGHDEPHERMVGAVWRLVKAGNAAKGVALYNRWARLAGYVPISLISEHPATVDAIDAVVALSNDLTMEVLLCR